MTLEHIGWAYGAADIALVRSAFDAEDIPVFLHGADVNMMMPHLAVALGGARITVFETDVVRGAALLDGCRLLHDTKPRWVLIAFLTALFSFFGAVPMPIRAIYMTDKASKIVRV